MQSSAYTDFRPSFRPLQPVIPSVQDPDPAVSADTIAWCSKPNTHIACFVTAHNNWIILVYRFVLRYNHTEIYQDALKPGITICWVPEKKYSLWRHANKYGACINWDLHEAQRPVDWSYRISVSERVIHRSVTGVTLTDRVCMDDNIKIGVLEKTEDRAFEQAGPITKGRILDYLID